LANKVRYFIYCFGKRRYDIDKAFLESNLFHFSEVEPEEDIVNEVLTFKYERKFLRHTFLIPMLYHNLTAKNVYLIGNYLKFFLRILAFFDLKEKHKDFFEFSYMDPEFYMNIVDD
jgi:hypothetical protein